MTSNALFAHDNVCAYCYRLHHLGNYTCQDKFIDDVVQTYIVRVQGKHTLIASDIILINSVNLVCSVYSAHRCGGSSGQYIVV